MSKEQHSKRDADTLKVLGIFLIVLSLPVLAGTAWADAAFPRIVNAIAGLILLAIGAGMFFYGRAKNDHAN